MAERIHLLGVLQEPLRLMSDRRIDQAEHGDALIGRAEIKAKDCAVGSRALQHEALTGLLRAPQLLAKIG